MTYWGISEVTLFLNEQATTDAFNHFIALLSNKTEDYNLVFYFCGHGQRDAGIIPNSYLLFFDNQLSLDSVSSRICQLRAQESYIFIDACSLRINSVLNPKLEEEINGHKISHKSLFCCLSGIQESFENDRYGYFTDALLNTLARLRKTDLGSTQFINEVCKTLKANNLPLPEMYNIGNPRLSFLTVPKTISGKDGLLYRPEMIAKIQDALIINRGKIGVLFGEKGSGKTSLCSFLTSESCKTIYISISHFSSKSIDLIDYLSIALQPYRPFDEWFANYLILVDQAENLNPKQLGRFVEEVANYRVQFLLISNQSLEEKLPSPLRHHLFQLKMDSFSFDEAEHLMVSFHYLDNERKLIHLASRGNPSKMQQLVHFLSHNTFEPTSSEKEKIYKTMAAIYGCGCYIDKHLFATVFQLSEFSFAFFENLGLVGWNENAWEPHPLFHELAESEPLTIDKDRVLEYWYRQMNQSPNHIRAAENLILSVKCFGYEKKADPYLKIAFKALYRNGKNHENLFIDGAQIFQSVSEMTEASTLLVEILEDLQQFEWANKLSCAKPHKKNKRRVLSFCLIAAIALALFFYQPFHATPQQIVGLKTTHPDFVGRNEYLHQIKDICLKCKGNASVAVLWGEAGIGKSEIAIAFANLYTKHFQLICWIDSETEESYTAGYFSLANLLKIPIDQENCPRTSSEKYTPI